jgi:hypothetical protein
MRKNDPWLKLKPGVSSCLNIGGEEKHIEEAYSARFRTGGEKPEAFRETGDHLCYNQG